MSDENEMKVAVRKIETNFQFLNDFLTQEV